MLNLLGNWTGGDDCVVSWDAALATSSCFRLSFIALENPTARLRRDLHFIWFLRFHFFIKIREKVSHHVFGLVLKLKFTKKPNELRDNSVFFSHSCWKKTKKLQLFFCFVFFGFFLRPAIKTLVRAGLRRRQLFQI